LTLTLATFIYYLRLRGEGGSPGEAAMAVWVCGIAAFSEGPFGTAEGFAEGEVIGGDVLLGPGKTLLCGGELVHEGEAEVLFSGGEIDLGEFVTEATGDFPADLWRPRPDSSPTGFTERSFSRKQKRT